MSSILQPVSARRRLQGIVGTTLVGLGALVSFGLLLFILGLIVKEGWPALVGRRVAEWPAAAWAALRPALPPMLAWTAAILAVAVACGAGLRPLLRSADRYGIVAAGTHTREPSWRSGLLRRLSGTRRHLQEAAVWIVRRLGGLPAWIVGAVGAYALVFADGLALKGMLLGTVAAVAACRAAVRSSRPGAIASSLQGGLHALLPVVAWMLGLFLLAHLAQAVLNQTFLGSYPSRFPSKAGIKAGIVGTVWVGAASMLVAIPLGVLAAIYLNEFARPGPVTSVLRASISNLAGVPSIVFGILGLALFVRAMSLGQSIASAGLTLGLLTLPIVIVVSEEALKSVPRSMREAAFGLGATRWQAVRHHVLPYALPGMLTSSILALSRTMGETAPLIIIGAALFIDFLPESPGDRFTALPMQTLEWAGRPQPEFHALAWGSVLVLITLVLAGNLAAILLRDRFQRRTRW